MEKKEKNNYKNKYVSVILLICFLFIIILTVFYTQNSNFRNWIDMNILRKIVTEEKVAEIILDSDRHPSIYAYSKYITVLMENELTTYNHKGKKEYSFNLNVSNPIYSSSGEYLAIAEVGKKQAYLISGKNIIWEKDVEGNISDIYVNKNGYVAITISDTSYKTVLAVYDSKGKQLFRKFLATSNIADVSISDDNSNLAIAEIDTSGILVQSKVEIIDIENAQENNKNSVIYTNNAQQGNMIISINYNSRNALVCMYDNCLTTLKNNQEEFIFDLKYKTDVFVSVDTKNHICRIVEEHSDSIYSKVHIRNVFNAKEKIYTINSAIKEAVYCEDAVGINIGTEAYFLNMSGHLIKKYTSSQEIQDMVLTEKIAGVIYKDKVKIISL